MKKLRIWLNSIFKKSKSNSGVLLSQLPVEPIEKKVPPIIVGAEVSQLDKDWQEFKRSDLTMMERHPLEQELKKKYAKPALKLLLEQLGLQEEALTKQSALENIRDGLQFINAKYPLDWKLDNNAVKEFDSTTRYMLNAHNVWLNENGAYCIEDSRQSEIIFAKPGAGGAEFEKPYDMLQ